MKIVLAILLIITIALLAVDFYFKYTEISSYQFQMLDTDTDIRKYIHADFDGDGQNEFIKFNFLQDGYGAFDTEVTGKPWNFHHMDPHMITSLFARDVNQDGCDDIIELKKDLDGDSIWCVVRDWSRQILCQTEGIKGKDISTQTVNYPNWDGDFHTCVISDLSGDGKNELILLMNTGCDLRPRGLFVYSFPEGRLIWKYLTGGSPNYIQITDIDNDSHPDIFFGTQCPGNMAEANGLIDTSGYVVRLTHDGKKVWHREVTPWTIHAWVLLTDLDDDSQSELYTCSVIGEGRSEKNVAIIEKLDPATGKILEKHAMNRHKAVTLLPAKLSLESGKQLLTNKGIEIFNKNLKLIRSVALTDHRVFGTTDFDGDGIDEILTHKDDSIFVLDTLLHSIAKFRSDKNLNIRSAFLHDSPSNIYFGRTTERLVYLFDYPKGNCSQTCVSGKLIYGATTQWESVVTSLKSYDWYNIILFLLAGCLVSGIVYRSRLLGQPVPQKPDIPPALTNLLTTLTTFNHGQTASSSFNRLAFLLKNIPEDPKVLEKFAGNLTDSVNTFQQFTLKQLNDITQQLHRTNLESVNTSKIERLSSELKSSLQSLSPNNPEVIGKQATQLKKTLPSVIEELRKEIKVARIAVRKHFRTRVVVELIDVLDSVKSQFTSADIKIPRVEVSGDVTAHAFFHPVEFSTIIEELLSNARVALAQSSLKKIRIKAELEDEITIRIIDTGPGVEQNNFTRIFDRGYSTKPKSGGYGLFHVMNTVSKYNGSIRLERSVPFEETVFVLNLLRV
ncbi:MAG: HAMP domain-containing sensor histidine kinase [candidate division Zixibacteria bacterium]|nr:HAMP domain-containing sensor histidine kinase [candidate division Zixibacteria bacterium]